MFVRRARPVRALLVGLTATSPAVSVVGAAPAAPGRNDTATTFTTPSVLGALADGGPCDTLIMQRNPGPPRTLTFAVSGINRPVTDVRLTLGLQHSYSSDVTVTLAGPGGTPQVTVLNGWTDCVVRANSNLGGTYTFADGGASYAAAAELPTTSVVPSGTYAPTVQDAPTTISDDFAGVDPNGTWTIRVFDSSNADVGAVTSATLTLYEDRTGPATTITAGPRNGSRLARPAAYRFASSAADVDRFECQVDTRPYTRCVSPFTVRGVQPGRHVLRVRGVDVTGNLGDPVTRTFVLRDVPCERATTKLRKAKKALKKAKRSGKAPRIAKAKKAVKKAARAKRRAC